MQCQQFKSTIPKTIFLFIRLCLSFQKKKGERHPPEGRCSLPVHDTHECFI